MSTDTPVIQLSAADLPIDLPVEPISDAVRGEILDMASYRARHSLEETAQRVHARILGITRQVGRLCLELGCYLWQVREYRLYEALGYPAFRDYLDSPEIGMSRGHLYKMVAIAETFCPALLIPPNGQPPEQGELLASPEDLGAIGVTRAYLIAPHIQAHPEEAEEWVARAKVLTRTDLELALLETAEPEIAQIRGAAFELGSKLVAIAYHLKNTQNDPLPILDELLQEAQRGRDWLETIASNRTSAST